MILKLMDWLCEKIYGVDKMRNILEPSCGYFLKCSKYDYNICKYKKFKCPKALIYHKYEH